jgi:hypothetical protein
LEYKANEKNEWILEKELDINSQLFLDKDVYYFKRGNDVWKQNNWTFNGFEEESQRYFFYDDYGQTITIDENIQKISWYFNRDDDGHPQNLIIYGILKKDNSIKPE